jgi:polar amino acid transport system substrate-binding protein
MRGDQFMKKVKSIIAVLAAGMLALSLAGCAASSSGSGSNATKNSSSSSQKATGTLQNVLKSHHLTVGVILSFPPFGSKDTSGKPQGYDVDMAKEVAKSLGLDPEKDVTFEDVTADARIPSLETGKVDLVIGNFTRTLERAQKIDFTNPYIVAGERLIVKKGSPIKGVVDMNGHKLAVVKGSTNADIVKKQAPQAEAVYFSTSAEAITAVKNGQADAFMEDSNFLAFQAKQNSDLQVIGDSATALEYNAFGVKKGDQDWLNYLNLFLFQINNDGTNKELYQKWFGTTLPYELNPKY